MTYSRFRANHGHLMVIILGLSLLLGGIAHADMPESLDGWWIQRTDQDYTGLIEKVEAAVKEAPMGVVFKASPTQVAKQRLGIELPGNMVIGVFAPNFAARLMEIHLPAQVEAPLRLYVTENEDGTATLSYPLPSVIFARYPAGGDALTELGAELDQILAAIASAAVAP